MFVRMISKKAIWEQEQDKSINEINADAITNCLKTGNKTLSLWHIEDESQINDVLIALSSNRETISRLDYIIIKEELIEKYGLQIKAELGKSPYTQFNDKHYDIVELNYGLLGKVSELILEIVKNDDKGIVRVSEKKIKSILQTAYNEHLLNTSLMKETLLEKIS